MRSIARRIVVSGVLAVAVPGCQAHQPKWDQGTCPPSQFEKATGYHSEIYEDYILAYVFADAPGGFYVDVGANDPNKSNTTKLFYDKGWSGVNIEPNSIQFAKIKRYRPRDRNFNCGVSDKEGSMTFYQGLGRQDQISTFDPALAESLRRDKGFKLVESQVPVMTLTTLLSTVTVPEISFMSIDVEGFEAHVIRGLDLSRFRPVVFCIEATRPGTEIPNYDEWEGILLKAGYVFAQFDGLNRYYVRKDRVDLLPRFIYIDMCVKKSKYNRGVKLDGFNEWNN